MDAKTKFGLKLRQLRKLKMLSQEELAHRANKSVEAISNIERGVSFPSVETLLSLGEALDIPLRDFFEADEGSAERDELMTTLLLSARSLDTSDLRIAAAQIAALAARKP